MEEAEEAQGGNASGSGDAGKNRSGEDNLAGSAGESTTRQNRPGQPQRKRLKYSDGNAPPPTPLERDIEVSSSNMHQQLVKKLKAHSEEENSNPKMPNVVNSQVNSNRNGGDGGDGAKENSLSRSMKVKRDGLITKEVQVGKTTWTVTRRNATEMDRGRESSIQSRRTAKSLLLMEGLVQVRELLELANEKFDSLNFE
ncbi:hypothetical protein HDU76_007965 [Blyttiomyces sp. JEL0837]|nr:hypothetical protein HDU76_007965 [Blyttiomyces sp. JEL0837]